MPEQPGVGEIRLSDAASRGYVAIDLGTLSPEESAARFAQRTPRTQEVRAIRSPSGRSWACATSDHRYHRDESAAKRCILTWRRVHA